MRLCPVLAVVAWLGGQWWCSSCRPPDRPGAAARLHARLLDAPTLAQRVVLVLEGRARVGVAEAATSALQVVHPPGEGDDTIVEEVERVTSEGGTVAVVTADRGLATRVEHLGVDCSAPMAARPP